MSSSIELTSFAARLRRLIQDFTSAPRRGCPQPQHAHSLLSLGIAEGVQDTCRVAAAGVARDPIAVPNHTTAGLPAFDQLALVLFALQFKHNAPYRRLCEARGVRPDTVAHWTEIPAVTASAFKEFEFSCLPAAERTAVFHSSGTTAQRPSRHFHNADSLALYEASLLAWFESHLPLAIGNWRRRGRIGAFADSRRAAPRNPELTSTSTG